MDLASNYEISRTAHFIKSRNFRRVALQFPDELLKESTRVVSALREELRSFTTEQFNDGGDDEVASLFVLADTTYGSCCVDEVGASHIDADCVVHYGHTCLSPTSTLPAFFVFGRASISVSDCVKSLLTCLSTRDKPVLVLFGLEYAHATQYIIESTTRETSMLSGSKYNSAVCYANSLRSVMDPLIDSTAQTGQVDDADIYHNDESCSDCNHKHSTITGSRYSIGGLTWNLPEGRKMEDYIIYWVGSDNTAFANVVLTFNNSEIVRYDPIENHLVTDFYYQRKLLMRRYYLVEKAKDANIIGILVGTLGVAGYLHMIHQMKELITKIGKKAYILVMGKPNPAKLANFPECDVFVYVSCAQTALLDSKEFLAPVITPFEATLAFSRGSVWNGSYEMEFQNLINPSSFEVSNNSGEARFSFLQGGYVEDVDLQDPLNALDLVETRQNAVQVRDKYPQAIVKGTATSVAEFFNSRSYHGLESQNGDSLPHSFVTGRTGKASCYEGEKTKEAS